MKNIKKSVFISICSVIIASVIIACKMEPTLPVIQYDHEKSNLTIIQTDKTANDTVLIKIVGILDKKMVVKDTTQLSINNLLENESAYKVAYHLYNNNNILNISVTCARGIDTTFQYKFSPSEIKPITVAKVVSGNCMGLYDVNYQRDFVKGIRQWLFNSQISPDDNMIVGMNNILRSRKRSEKNEYYPLSNNIPIVSSISNMKFKFSVDLPGDYFYLYSFPCKTGKPIKSFIERKIADNLSDAAHTPKDLFSCSNQGGEGPNILFLVSIDKNWKYELLPVGLIVIDQEGPIINRDAIGPYSFSTMVINDMTGRNNTSWPKYTVINRQNMLVHIPDIPSLNSYVSISTGNFQGDDYFGYNVPFTIKTTGDVKTVKIANHIINIDNSNNCKKNVRIKFKNLHTGDNYIPVTATDARGNTSKESIHIRLVPVRNNYRDNDYDDLEDRINDLESRIEELE